MAESGDGLMGARIVIIVVMILSGLFVFLPFTKRCAKTGNEDKNSCKHVFFSVSACFAAGLLMSISVLHILPESNEMYEGVMAKWEAEEEAAHALELLNPGVEAHEDEDHHDEEEDDHAGETEDEHAEHEGEAGHGGHAFPLPFLIFQAGFFLMLLMNLIFHQAHGSEGGDKSKDAERVDDTVEMNPLPV